MKKINLLAGLILLTSIGFLTSCKKDEPIDPPIVAGEINTYTAVLMGGQANSTTGSFYSTATNSVMLKTPAYLPANQSKIDMIYYFGTANSASIVAPASPQLDLVTEFAALRTTWAIDNDTKFKLVTGTIVWADVTNDALITANVVALTDLNVNNLAVGNTIAFETAATSTNPSKKGLFKVIALTGTTGADRSITIEVKIQK